jgi:CheY-like chemotaxis protein
LLVRTVPAWYTGKRGRIVADVLALVDDLFFQAKMTETARRLGVALQTVSNGPALVAAAAPQAHKLVLVDLNARQGVLAAVAQLKAAGNAQPIVGFLSHVQTELAEQARAAGCQDVMPRSKFTAELAEILSRVKS